MSVDINHAVDDFAWVRGDSISSQSLYHVPSDGTTAINVDVAAADATNPRIDQVVLEVKDSQYDGGTPGAAGEDIAQIRVVAGTPTGGATTDNRNGVAALPPTALLLADILVPAASASVVTANIRDRRSFCTEVIPPSLSIVQADIVPLIPVPGVPIVGSAQQAHASHDLYQAAYLAYLPRRIVSATRIRWRYTQGATANTGNYVLAIFDASTRKVIDTGSVAFAGAALSVQARAETIAATTFEPGAYFVFIGYDTATASGTSAFPGVGLPAAAVETSAAGLLAAYPNSFLRSTTGGVTVPTTLGAFTDVGVGVALTTSPGVPLVALSVG